MAVGDLIVGTSAANTAITFTPAAGVEVMILAVSLKNSINSLK